MRSLRIRQVMQLTGLFRITIYRLQLAGEFPKRRQLSENSVAWGETDIPQWVNEVAHVVEPQRRQLRPARRSPEGVAQQLHAFRSTSSASACSSHTRRRGALRTIKPRVRTVCAPPGALLGRHR